MFVLAMWYIEITLVNNWARYRCNGWKLIKTTPRVH